MSLKDNEIVYLDIPLTSEVEEDVGEKICISSTSSTTPSLIKSNVHDMDFAVKTFGSSFSTWAKTHSKGSVYDTVWFCVFDKPVDIERFRQKIQDASSRMEADSKRLFEKKYGRNGLCDELILNSPTHHSGVLPTNVGIASNKINNEKNFKKQSVKTFTNKMMDKLAILKSFQQKEESLEFHTKCIQQCFEQIDNMVKKRAQEPSSIASKTQEDASEH
ncbi:hypothetical protein BdWA1_000743 [Babesia duncani]|uniref:Uncharacterized protein n=1 Tax=Babesia duncani TaxID=323732 RepID=A0AAD9UQD0_9APIC|nr:hypothetical protein BdWA1_000743 [Babesia duncani]